MSDEEDLYDEFGNYIGPDLDSSDDDDDEDDAEGDDHGGGVPRQAGLHGDDDASDVSVEDHHNKAAAGTSAMVIHDDDANHHNGEMAMADPMTVFRSMASWKTTAETTMMMTRLAVLSTEEVTDPTKAVKAKAHSL